MVVLGGVFLVCACAGGFQAIYPGMTVPEVNHAMKNGPTRIEQLSGGYSSWYYGEDQCLLMKDEKVASKDQSQEKGGLSVFGIGGAKERRLAECVPPGQERAKKVERSVETPWGTVKK